MSTSSEPTTSTSDGRSPDKARVQLVPGLKDGTQVLGAGSAPGTRIDLNPKGAGFYLVQRGPWRESINTRISLTALSPHDPGQDPGAGFSAFEGMPLGVG